jgi:hypothetical protein
MQAAVRWLARYALKGKDVRLMDVQLAAAAVGALRGLRRGKAERVLMGFCEQTGEAISTASLFPLVELSSLVSCRVRSRIPVRSGTPDLAAVPRCDLAARSGRDSYPRSRNLANKRCCLGLGARCGRGWCPHSRCPGNTRSRRRQLR